MHILFGRLIFFGFVIFSSACSAQLDAPQDMFVDGPIKITTEWKTIKLPSPLKASPHIQHLGLLSCNSKYEFTDSEKNIEKNFLMPERFKRLVDDKVVEPEVILNDGKKDYVASYRLNGSLFVEKGNCLFIGFTLINGKKKKFYLPEKTEFKDIKIKANIDMEIDYLYWFAPYYERWPNKKWSDVLDSEIIELR